MGGDILPTCYKGIIMAELVKLKKGDKIITRTKFDYEKNLIHWKLRGFDLVDNKPAEKPKKTRKKKED
nr:hypothetical protein [uncultured Mediterranean phage uvMED]